MRPNIVFFIADDMQPYMFNCLEVSDEPYLTPNLDRLAAEGTLMAEQYVSAPVCTPSRYTCLTGQYASRAASIQRTIDRDGQSVIGWNTMIMPGQPTVASVLQKAGYKTGFVGKNHCIEAPGRKKIGYREDPHDPDVHARMQEDQRIVCEAVRNAGFDYAKAIYYNNPDHNGPKELGVHNLDWVTQAGLEFIDQNKDEPFFLYFATTVPHGPGEAERSWNADRRATAGGLLDEPIEVLPAKETLPQRIEEAGLRMTDQRANVLWLDDALGALVDKLEESGLTDNTVIFFFTDHGQGAKGTLYEGGVHDPSLVWKKGGFPVGSQCDVQVLNTDFAPTILDLAGITSESSVPKSEDVAEMKFDGASFLPALQGDESPIHDSIYCEMGYSRAVIRGRWKYLALRYPERVANMSLEERRKVLDGYNERAREHDKRIITTDPTEPFSHISAIPGGAGAEAASTGKLPGYYDADQLYDLQTDPGERRNLAYDPDYADVLDMMKGELKKHLNALPGGFAELK